jgi:hypothetical protein
VTALLDFEWARFGEPADDWFFLARFSGPHMEAVLDVIARATAASVETPPGWLPTVSADLRNSSPGATGGATPGNDAVPLGRQPVKQRRC